MKKTLILILIAGVLLPQAAFAQYSTDAKANALIVNLMARIESLEKELAQFKEVKKPESRKLTAKEKKELEKAEKRKKSRLDREAKKEKIEEGKKANLLIAKRERYVEVLAKIESLRVAINQYKYIDGENRKKSKYELNKDKTILVDYPRQIAELTLEKIELEEELDIKS